MVLFLSVYSVFGNIFPQKLRMNYITWFFVIYLIGSYIRLYPNKVFESKKISTIATTISISFSIATIFICLYLGKKTGEKNAYYYISDSNKILAVITSVSLFLTFKNMSIRYNKTINKIAESIFGVLLIHANSDPMRKFLWGTLLHNKEIKFFKPYEIILHSILCVLLIFTICSLIDQIRIKLIEKPIFIFYEKINNKEIKK